jgi:hypothetical protein
MTKIAKAVAGVFFTSLALAASASAGKPAAYTPSLTTSLQAAAAATSLTAAEGTQYTISGCGYNSAYGMVTIEVFTPVGVGWVATNPDAAGCISVSNFSTVGPGSYKIDAWQQLRNKQQVVAEIVFKV